MPLNVPLPVIYASILMRVVVQGTLTPDGTVSLDCGSQQTFTCSVNVNGTAAVFTISGLNGIIAEILSGKFAANKNVRITTTDTSGITQSSTITITGFTAVDEGGTIQCINLADGSVQGMSNISVGIPSCPNGVDLVNSTLQNNECVISLTWQQPPNTPPVTSTTVTYCPTSSPNCGNSMNCTSPCTISGLLNDTEYNFTVIPNNNCGGPTGCTENSVTHQICPTDTTPTTGSTPEPTVSTVLIIGIVVAVVLLALIIAIITIILICCLCPGVKTCFVTTCCCKLGSDAKNKPPSEEQPRGDYADPQTVRDNKEMTEGNGITYAALQFSEEAGGNGKNGIHCKEELGNVQYSEVERLQV